MENNNDKSKTEKFTPMNKSPKQEINRSAGDAYSEARRTPQYDFRDDEEDNGGNNKLIVVSVILAVLLVIAVVASILLIGSNKKEKPEDENPPLNIEETLEEEEENEEKTNLYNIVFYGETVIQKNNYTIIDADLYDEEMNKVESRKIKISPETRIISDGKSISENSLIYLIQDLAGEKIVFEGTIREEDGLALKLTFEYHAEEMPETNEGILEEPTEEEPPVEEPVDDPVLDIPTENEGAPIE